MKPEEVDVDLSQVPFDEAVLHLRQTVALEPGLWRAHYYLGKIARAHDHAKLAADEFAIAIRDDPREAAPVIALAELLGYDAKGDDAKAIEAFDKALDLKRDDAKSLFQRGQAYFHVSDLVHAKADLEAFVKIGSGSQLAFAHQQANRMLMEIAAKARGRH